MKQRLPLLLVYRRVFGAYRAEWSTLLLAGAIIFVPLGAFDALAHDLSVLPLGDSGVALWIGAGIASGIVTLTLTLGMLVYAGFVERLYESYARGEPRPGVWEVARGLSFVRLLVADVILSLLIAVGLVLLLIPGLLVFVWYSLSAPLISAENLDVRRAFERSRQLVRGHFWRVFAALVLPLILKALIDQIVGAADAALLGSEFLASWVTASVSSIIAMPIAALALVAVTDQLARMKASPGKAPPRAEVGGSRVSP